MQVRNNNEARVESELKNQTAIGLKNKDPSLTSFLDKLDLVFESKPKLQTIYEIEQIEDMMQRCGNLKLEERILIKGKSKQN